MFINHKNDDLLLTGIHSTPNGVRSFVLPSPINMAPLTGWNPETN